MEAVVCSWTPEQEARFKAEMAKALVEAADRELEEYAREKGIVFPNDRRRD